MLENMETLPAQSVVARVREIHADGFRFVTVTACANADGTVDVFYSFDKNFKLVTLKTTVEAGATVESVSGVYLAAAFVENEISELFGLKFSGLVVDYGGRFMLAEGAPESPFGTGVIIERKGGDKNAG